jgi:hypothetical protein
LRGKLEPLGLLPTDIDPSLYRMDMPGGKKSWLLDWVDDMVLASHDLALMDWIHEQLSKDFKITNMGPVQRYIGMWVVRDERMKQGGSCGCISSTTFWMWWPNTKKTCRPTGSAG